MSSSLLGMAYTTCPTRAKDVEAPTTPPRTDTTQQTPFMPVPEHLQTPFVAAPAQPPGLSTPTHVRQGTWNSLQSDNGSWNYLQPAQQRRQMLASMISITDDEPANPYQQRPMQVPYVDASAQEYYIGTTAPSDSREPVSYTHLTLPTIYSV